MNPEPIRAEPARQHKAEPARQHKAERNGLWFTWPRAALAGLAIAAGLPPWGWWPLSLIGIGAWFAGINGLDTRRRFARSLAVTVFWFAPATFWMFDMTAIGWPVAVLVQALIMALAGVLTPPHGPWRRVCFTAGLVVCEIIRWNWPLGGVPIATLAMAGVSTPFAISTRLFGSPLLVAMFVTAAIVGVDLIRRNFGFAAVGVAVIFSATLGGHLCGGLLVPVKEMKVAVIQGGGPQNTRAELCENRNVFERHVEATDKITQDVDLVVWPEDVVHPSHFAGSALCSEPLLSIDEAESTMKRVAADTNAVVISGWFGRNEDRTANQNYVVAQSPDGSITGRYDKVQLVPFGEFVPLRDFVEFFSGELPATDVGPGSGPAVVDSALGPLGVSISWEIFFDRRARDAVNSGGQVLLNPTNGSSYRFTIIQAQQIAASRLRALEAGRWVLQAAPTGFSAVISPDGEVIHRTGIGEQKVLYATVELLRGRTPAVAWGAIPIFTIPMLLLSIVVMAWVWGSRQRRDPLESDTSR